MEKCLNPKRIRLNIERKPIKVEILKQPPKNMPFKPSPKTKIKRTPLNLPRYLWYVTHCPLIMLQNDNIKWDNRQNSWFRSNDEIILIDHRIMLKFKERIRRKDKLM